MLSLGALIEGRILCIHPMLRNKARYKGAANLGSRLDTKCKPAFDFQEYKINQANGSQ